MNETSHAPSRSGPQSALSGRDYLVISCAAIAAAAFGFGLGFHAGLNGVLAIAGAIVLFFGLGTLHLVKRRLESVGRIRSKVDHLEEAVHGMRAGAYDDADHAGLPAGVLPDGSAGAESETGHGWGEPGVVDDLVRKLADELGRDDGADEAGASHAVAGPAGRPVREPSAMPDHGLRAGGTPAGDLSPAARMPAERASAERPLQGSRHAGEPRSSGEPRLQGEMRGEPRHAPPMAPAAPPREMGRDLRSPIARELPAREPVGRPLPARETPDMVAGRDPQVERAPAFGRAVPAADRGERPVMKAAAPTNRPATAERSAAVAEPVAKVERTPAAERVAAEPAPALGAAGATAGRAPVRTAAGRIDPTLVADTLAGGSAASLVEIHLQPVLDLGERKARFYSVCPRIRAAGGELIAPADYQRMAEETGALVAIEEAVLTRTIQILKALVDRQKAKPFLLSLSARSLSDATFLRLFLEMMKANRPMANYLVFEIAQDEFLGLGRTERESMDALARLGFRFALDRVTSLDIDENALVGARVGFVMAEPETLRREESRVGASYLADRVTAYRDAGIEVIAEAVASDADIVLAKVLGISLGVGRQLSEPRPLRPELLGETAAPAARRGSGAA
ncbi:MAG: EAL domain-containing protein [Hyphomicrobiaceae bacterium]